MEPMVKPTGTIAIPPLAPLVQERLCAHSRMIDDVLTRGGKRTGKVRCLECRAVLDDPYQGNK